MRHCTHSLSSHVRVLSMTALTLSRNVFDKSLCTAPQTSGFCAAGTFEHDSTKGQKSAIFSPAIHSIGGDIIALSSKAMAALL